MKYKLFFHYVLSIELCSVYYTSDSGNIEATPEAFLKSCLFHHLLHTDAKPLYSTGHVFSYCFAD